MTLYEDDEPVDEVVAAFERGKKGVTRRRGVRNVKAPDLSRREETSARPPRSGPSSIRRQGRD